LGYCDGWHVGEAQQPADRICELDQRGRPRSDDLLQRLGWCERCARWFAGGAGPYQIVERLCFGSKASQRACNSDTPASPCSVRRFPHDSALISVGAQLFFTPNWSFLAKFDGEFAKGSDLYAGSETLRYTR
jgi:hypothetical protein